MKIDKTTIKTEAIYSDDKSHRYFMSKVWDNKKPIVTVISISPSSKCGIKSDLTTQLITNNVKGLGYGGFELVNLISLVDVNAKKLKDLTDSYDESTDKFILESCQRTQLTVFAWGKIATFNKSFLARENEVVNLIKEYIDKQHCICDLQGRNQLHPLTPSVRNEWIVQSVKI